MIRSTFFAVAVTLLSCTPVFAQPGITVGSHLLQPNTPNQTIEIFVSGTQQVETLNLNVQVSDGAGTTGPIIQSIDVVTGTIFAAPNNDGGQFDILTDPQVFATTVATPFTTPATTVSTDGLLATLIFDTTGVFSGTFDLKLSDTLNGDTDFGFDSDFNLIVPIITNGQITVIPEPGTALLITMGGIPVLTRRKRRAY